ncbi:interferon-induced very large GTPase 1-like [Scyliorhinus canicula]|uniref:interferon-induced very large GTPase 1-like n=1 Tax=Scyliorhinus canicula TaxID=7830 RepID=UPI0018F31649|nr:interferon-induced very large GTPase 1-like [Scyliorhinus canicula]
MGLRLTELWVLPTLGKGGWQVLLFGWRMAGEHSPSEIVRKMRRKLMNVLQERPNIILDELDATLIITSDEYNQIDGIADPMAKIRKLINVVIEKGEESCENFLGVLQSLRSELPGLDDVLSDFNPATRGESWHTNVIGTPAAERPLPDREQRNKERMGKKVLGCTVCVYFHTRNIIFISYFTVKKKNFQEVISKLKLQRYFRKKLSLSKILEIGPETMVCAKPQSSRDIPWYFLKKLMILNLTARNIRCLADIPRDETAAVDETDFSKLFDIPGKAAADSCNPLDVITAIFLCSDSFLQQEMLTKMSMCQFALPLLLPDYSKDSITLLLWAMRFIVKKWRPQSLEESKGFKEAIMATTPMHVISFLRLGRCSTSKSKVLNEVLSNPHHHHNFFITRSMECGDIPRKISDGLVEFCWYLPCGKRNIDIFTEPLLIANLRGDASVLDSQVPFLAQVSSAVFIFVDQIGTDEFAFLESIAELQTQYFLILNPQPDQGEMTSSFLQKLAPLMKLERNHIIIKNQNMNASEFVGEIQSRINSILRDVTDLMSIEEMAAGARELEICVDEDEPRCQHAKEVAEEITDAIKDMQSVAEYKIKKLPLQGELWKKWSKLGKELCRQRKRGDKAVEMYNSELRLEQTNLRKKQLEYDITENLSEFVAEMVQMKKDEKHFFLKWIKYLLDAIARQELSQLREIYKQQYKDSPGASEKLMELDKQISDSSLGLEHFMREIGQIYEAEATLVQEHILSGCNSQYTALPSIAADLMLDGFPLELLDGDTSSISEQWVSAVLTNLSKKLGPDTRIVVLTVLGVQSTGKSTLLNTMFGLQFAVSSGRCTRGAFMQLIKITGDLKEEIGSEYLMIIDTEGLKAPELAKLEDSHEHDNELATLVVGLSDVTLVNMAMENSSEMKDILQIVVHAFLRMKEVGHKPNCQFIHQNVGEVSAHDQNMRDRKHLLDQLNEMTRAAAKMEKKENMFTTFSDVMEYDPEKNNWYIPGLWHGVPPMAPVNTGYSENIFELKKYLFDLFKQRKVTKKPFTIHQFTEWMKSLWNAVKYENFIFSFRNSLVADAYCQLSLKYAEWEWQFRKIMHFWVEKAENNIDNHPLNQLDDLYQTLIQESNTVLQTQRQKILNHLEEYFNSKVENIHLVEKFKTDFTLSAESLRNELEIYSKQKCDNAIQRRKGMDKLVNIQMEYQENIQRQVNELLQSCNQSEIKLDDILLQEQFEKMWRDRIKPLQGMSFQKQNIEAEFENQLRQSLSLRASAVCQRLAVAGKLSTKGKGPFVVIKDHITKHCLHKVWEFFTRPGRNELQMFTDVLIKNSEVFAQDKVKAKVDFDQTYCQMLLKTIDKNLHKENNNFHTNANFEVDLKLHICGRVLPIFQKMHQDFFRENDPLTRLEEMKSAYFSTFKDLYQEKDQSQKRAQALCSNCLQPALQNATDKRLGVEIVEDVKASCTNHELSSRAYLQAVILLELLEEHCVENYIQYITNYKDFAKQWIRERIIKNYTEGTKLAAIATKIIQALIRKTKDAIEQAMATEKENVSEFLTEFCDILKDDFVIDKGSLEIVIFQNATKASEFAADVTAALDDVELNLILGFNEDCDIKEILPRLPVKPDEEIFRQVLGCGKMCPFCGVPCERGGSGHKEHFAATHRPKGLNGYHHISSEKLSVTVCTSSVASDGSFRCAATQYEFHPYKAYRSVNDYYASWNIPPDTSIQSAAYWKYVLCIFNKEFAEAYNTKKADIPADWKTIQKETIKAEIKKTYSM